jgi:23S rRNA pseudouridine1911/1915/1917 synthase
MIKEALIYEEEQGVRLDRFLTDSFPSLSRNYFEKAISRGNVFVNGNPSKKSLKLQRGDAVLVEFLPLEPLDISPVPMDIPVLYEDDDLALVYKSPQLVCHPGVGTLEPTLIHGLLHRFQDLKSDDPVRPGLVHRLDKDTSGIMLIAKNMHTHELLSSAFKNRLVHRNLSATTVDAPIGRHPTDRKKMGIVETAGKEAITAFVPVAFSKSCSLVLAYPKTGRTHQIRVHLQHINHPIVGDPLYGFFGTDKLLNPPRILLHALSLEFIHPHTKKLMQFETHLPKDFEEFLLKRGFDPDQIAPLTQKQNLATI